MRYSPSCKGIIRRLVTQASSGNENTVIAKGTGSVGNKGYKLRKSMELVHDADLYKRILVSIALESKGDGTYSQFQRSVRDLCHEARIDFNVPYSKQSMTRLGKLFAAVSVSWDVPDTTDVPSRHRNANLISNASRMIGLPVR
jgi:hypothetical protein